MQLSLLAQTSEQTVNALSLDRAVKLALDSNLNLKKSEIDLAASGYSEKNIWSEIFPTISASASIGYSNPLFGPASNNPGLNYSVGFGISLGLNAGIPYTIKNIKLAHEGNILRYEDACNQLSIQVTKRFYSLVAEKNNLLLLEEILNLAQRQYERNEISFKNGIVGELALTQSKLAVENARYNLNTAVISNANSMGEFLAMLGMPSNANVALSGEINIIKIEANADMLINQHLPGRPDIERGRQEIERLVNAERQIVMQSRAPSLNLSVDWSSRNFNPYTDTFSASARLSIPIDPWIPGTSRSQSVSRANDSIKKAKLDLSIAEDSAKTQIRSLTALLGNSWNSIEIAILSHESAERSYQLTELGFRNGTVEYLTLENARNNMASAKQRLLQSELSYFNMILDLSAALNADWKYLIQTFGVSGEKK
ncbi:MAG: TolC family protein [Treponema sp.]|nr:TolC family protein [Treponema sp.]